MIFIINSNDFPIQHLRIDLAKRIVSFVTGQRTDFYVKYALILVLKIFRYFETKT